MNQTEKRIAAQYKTWMVNRGILWAKYANLETMYNEYVSFKKFGGMMD